MEHLRAIVDKYFFSDRLSLDARMLNAVYVVGFLVAVASFVTRAMMRAVPEVLMIVLVIAVAVVVLAYLCNRYQLYDICAVLTVIGVCFFLLPGLYFFMGGVVGNMIGYFILGLTLIFLLMRGKRCAVFVALHFALTIFCVSFDRLRPGFVLGLSGGQAYWDEMIQWDYLQTYLVVGLCIGLIIRLQNWITIRERRRVEEGALALAAAQRTTALIFDSNPNVNVLMDENLNVLECNPAVVSFAAHNSKDELVGRNMRDMLINLQARHVGTDDPRSIVEMMLETLHGDEVKFEVELIIVGRRHVAIVDMKRIQYGGRDALALYLTDVTSLRKTAEELERRDNMLEAVAGAASILASYSVSFEDAVRESMSVLASSAEVDRVYIWQSCERDGKKGYKQIYEWLSAVGHNVNTVRKVTGEAYINSLPAWEEHFSRGAYINGAARTLTQEEQTMLHAYDVQSILVLPVFLQNVFWGFLSFDDCRRERTFTESEVHILQSGSLLIANAVLREEMTNRMQISAMRLHSVIANYSGIIWSVDKNGIITTFDGKYLEKIGVTPDFLEGKPLERARLKNRHFDVMDNTKLALQGEPQDWIGDIDGRRFHHQVTPLHDENGDIFGVMGSTDDITDMIKLQEDLKIAVEEAQAASRAKSDFLANMSHEIRTPLNAIIGMDAIGHHAKAIERKDYAFDKIHDASTHLLGVINDILDVSKIEAGKFELSYETYNFERMLRKVSDVINFRVDEKKQRFHVRIDPNIPQMLIGDDQRLAQVITNLLGNAVKFTPEGGSVGANAKLIAQDEDTVTLQIEVSDSGIGLSAAQQGRLFQSFQQADSSTTRKFGGTGLGLVISKQIVEMMGGHIWIESELGKGAKFAFTIKARRGASAEERQPSLAWKDVRVLAVDDMPDALEYFTEIAARLGFICETAENGEQALKMIERNGGYDIYFIDWKIPGMDGIEITRRIKALGGEKSVVTMMSSAEWSAVEGEAKDAGVDRFLAKPLFPSAIADCISEILGFSSVLQESGDDAPTYDFSGHVILLAEDVEVNREIVTSLLEPTQIEIDTAENGEVALRKFMEAPERYDVVFMDVQMPEMDGFESTRRIRALPIPQAKVVPIVAMTANVFREDIEKCLSAGMTDHVGKPLDIGDVLAKLKKYLI